MAMVLAMAVTLGHGCGNFRHSLAEATPMADAMAMAMNSAVAFAMAKAPVHGTGHSLGQRQMAMATNARRCHAHWRLATAQAMDLAMATVLGYTWLGHVHGRGLGDDRGQRPWALASTNGHANGPRP